MSKLEALAAAAQPMSQPSAAARVYMQEVQASRESHNAFLAALAQHPKGPMMRDIYLECLQRKAREGGGAVNSLTSEKSMYNATVACQQATFAQKLLAPGSSTESSLTPK